MTEGKPQYGGTSLAGIIATGYPGRPFDRPIDGPWAAEIHNGFHYNNRVSWRFDRKRYDALPRTLAWSRV